MPRRKKDLLLDQNREQWLQDELAKNVPPPVKPVITMQPHIEAAYKRFDDDLPTAMKKALTDSAHHQKCARQLSRPHPWGMAVFPTHYSECVRAIAFLDEHEHELDEHLRLVLMYLHKSNPEVAPPGGGTLNGLQVGYILHMLYTLGQPCEVQRTMFTLSSPQ